MLHWLFRSLSIVLLLSTVSYGDITTGLLSYWRMNEGSGTTVDDTGSLNNDLTFPTAPNDPTWVTSGCHAPNTNCLNFNSTNSEYLSVGTSTNYELSAFSISLWFRTSAAAAQVLAVKTIWGHNYGWLARLYNTTQLGCQVQDSGGGTNIVVTPGVAYSDGNWHHFVCTYDAATNTFNFYYDNNKTVQGATTDIAYEASTPFYLGRGEAGGPFLNGDMQEFRYYNRALSDADVTELFTGSAPSTTIRRVLGY